MNAEYFERVREFVCRGIDLKEGRIEAEADPFWAGLAAVGTEPWLDTGDIDAASKLWNTSFTCLTTNNTLLNKEVQKGIYDDLVKEAAQILSDIADPAVKVREIAFILNARHGLRLVQRFGGRVSVELHTDVSHDVQTTIEYGRRFYAVCPEYFIIKVPLTPAGLLATRQLREDGIPVNFTLGFSARQNVLATAVARPSFLNVFLGRLNSYVSDNRLGEGSYVGEKATIASQLAVRETGARNPEPTRQIAASLRKGEQVALLAGVDVQTIPTTAVEDCRATYDGNWRSRLGENYAPAIDAEALRKFHMDVFWDVSAAPFRSFIESLYANLPTTPEELVARCYEHGVGDLFPKFSKADLDKIMRDGKIPKHQDWADRIESGEIGIDALLTEAALLSFTTDQKALDDRIRSLL